MTLLIIKIGFFILGLVLIWIQMSRKIKKDNGHHGRQVKRRTRDAYLFLWSGLYVTLLYLPGALSTGNFKAVGLMAGILLLLIGSALFLIRKRVG